jgi:hypothetical protein
MFRAVVVAAKMAWIGLDPVEDEDREAARFAVEAAAEVAGVEVEEEPSSVVGLGSELALHRGQDRRNRPRARRPCS